MTKAQFRKTMYDYYRRHGRRLPWRERATPYNVLVSEIMLQQTQVPRVIPKFKEFIKAFPNLRALAHASAGDVIKAWHGLGYNRRALYVQQSARLIVTHYRGRVPRTVAQLNTLPGIGYATACSIAAFAFNQPVIFIETNIRTVFLHCFFSGKTNVSDTALLPLVTTTFDKKNPRRWYAALMDYGAHLKNTVGNASRRSKHYAKQSPFQTSNRRIRGLILKQFVTRSTLTEQQVLHLLRDTSPTKVKQNIITLHQEGFITQQGKKVYILSS